MSELNDRQEFADWLGSSGLMQPAAHRLLLNGDWIKSDLAFLFSVAAAWNRRPPSPAAGEQKPADLIEAAANAAENAYIDALHATERGEFSQPNRQTREAIGKAVRDLAGVVPQGHAEPAGYLCPNDPDQGSAFRWRGYPCKCGTKPEPLYRATPAPAAPSAERDAARMREALEFMLAYENDDDAAIKEIADAFNAQKAIREGQEFARCYCARKMRAALDGRSGLTSADEVKGGGDA